MGFSSHKISGYTVYGILILGYHNIIIVYMYLVGRLNDVGGCVASYLYLEPSDGIMDKNAFFYKSKAKIPEEKFVPRPVSEHTHTHVYAHKHTYNHYHMYPHTGGG